MLPKYNFPSAWQKDEDMESVPKTRSAYMLIYERSKEYQEEVIEETNDNVEHVEKYEISLKVLTKSGEISTNGALIASLFASKVLTKVKTIKKHEI